MFFDYIRNMGGKNHTLEFKLISGNSGEQVNIQKFNKYFYDNIILMAPTVKDYGMDLKIKEILEFVDFHHNLMIFLNSESRQISRDLANEFGVNFDEFGYTLNGGKQAEKTAQVAFRTQNVAWSQSMFEPLTRVFTKPTKPILVEDGIGAVLDTNLNNQHVFPILKGDVGIHSRNPSQEGNKEFGLVSGSQLTIVAGYQTQYNQRIVISGSLKMCSNAAFMATRNAISGDIKSSSNYVLCTEMVEWNLQEKGVLKVDNIKHNKLGDKWNGANPENYKREVDIEYFIDINEKKNGEWIPYVADDVQF